MSRIRSLRLGNGRCLEPSPVFDTYWHFAAARQAVFVRRIAGDPPPWTADPIISSHRFTNAYRAADRVSQYLIRHVIYEGSTAAEEVVFRTLLFKLFNRIDTWELLVANLGATPTWRAFDAKQYGSILDTAMANGERLYSAAYIMPSPGFGHVRKHRNHLELIDRMMRDDLAAQLGRAKALKEVFELLLGYPSLGAFLAFQFTIDLNYSNVIEFDENDFVVAGPGARDGMKKCFRDTTGVSDEEVIALMARSADEEFERLGLSFQKLGGSRELKLIDCQNLFCEVDKYARVAHPDVAGLSGRTRIKQKFSPNLSELPQFYPPKWGLDRRMPVEQAISDGRAQRARQMDLPFAV